MRLPWVGCREIGGRRSPRLRAAQSSTGAFVPICRPVACILRGSQHGQVARAAPVTAPTIVEHSVASLLAHHQTRNIRVV